MGSHGSPAPPPSPPTEFPSNQNPDRAATPKRDMAPRLAAVQFWRRKSVLEANCSRIAAAPPPDLSGAARRPCAAGPASVVPVVVAPAVAVEGQSFAEGAAAEGAAAPRVAVA